MNKYYEKIIQRKTTMVKSSLLYSIGTILFSFSSMLWLVVVTRSLNTVASGIFSIGWAICQQMATIGYFGTRNVQVSDIDDNFNSINFIILKIATIISMIGVSFFYCAYLDLSNEKSKIAILLTLLMAVEALADLSAGFFQKKDRLDITGLSYIIRVSLYSSLFVITLILFKSLVISIICALIVSLIWIFIYDLPLLSRLDFFKFEKFSFRVLYELTMMCVPIFLSSYLTNLLITIPKNSIELNLTTIDQSSFNLIFMPSSIMKLVLGILIIPLYRKIAIIWKEKKYREFEAFILKIILLIFVLTLLLIVLTLSIGVPLLSIIYGLDISSQKLSLIILIVAGSINGITTFLIFILTILNKQFFLIYTYVVVVFITMLFTNTLVINYHILGASVSYLLSSSILLIILFVLCFLFIKKEKKTTNVTVM